MDTWQKARADVDRWMRSAVAIYVFGGIFISLVGLVAAALIWRIRGDAAIAGSAAAFSMVIGLVLSRRGRKVLMSGDPLVVKGRVTQKHVVEGRRNQFLLVMTVKQGWRLNKAGELEPDPALIGPRTISSRQTVFDQARIDQSFTLICLPNGEGWRQAPST